MTDVLQRFTAIGSGSLRCNGSFATSLLRGMRPGGICQFQEVIERMPSCSCLSQQEHNDSIKAIRRVLSRHVSSLLQQTACVLQQTATPYEVLSENKLKKAWRQGVRKESIDLSKMLSEEE